MIGRDRVRKDERKLDVFIYLSFILIFYLAYELFNFS